MRARIGDAVQPVPQLSVEVVEVAERARQEEVFSNIAKRSLDLALLSSPGLQFVLTLKRA